MESLEVLSDESNHGVRQAFSDGHLADPHRFYEFALPWMLRSVDEIVGALLTRLPERASAEASTLLPSDVRDEALLAIARVSPLK